MAEDGERKKGMAEGREKGAIRWRGEEEMVAAQEKWPDIGERISCVGPFVMLRPVTEEGEWMEVQRVAAKGEGAEVVGVVGVEWWTVGLSHQGCLLTCATKRDIHQAGRRRRFTQPHGRGTHARMPDSHSHKRAPWSQPGAPVHHPENSITPSSVEGCSATPLLGAGKGVVIHCCSSIWEVFPLFFIVGGILSRLNSCASCSCTFFFNASLSFNWPFLTK